MAFDNFKVGGEGGGESYVHTAQASINDSIWETIKEQLLFFSWCDKYYTSTISPEAGSKAEKDC